MKPIKAGSTSKSIDLFIQDSSSTTGAGLTGLVFNSGGLTAYYHRPGSNPVAIALVTQTPTGAYATTGGVGGGFCAIDGTNMPGVYRLDIPDAALAAGVDEVVIMLKGATNMAPLLQKIILTAMDLQDGVRGGMTALPNAAAAASGGLPTVDANNSVKVQSGIKKNSALANFPFVMIDTTTNLPVTGKTVSVSRSLDGGVSFASVGTATEMANGWYQIDLAAGDMNGDNVALRMTATGCYDRNIALITEP